MIRRLYFRILSAWDRYWAPVQALDHGADPTGQADSTQALQDALEAAFRKQTRLSRFLRLFPPLRRLESRRRTVVLGPGSFLVVHPVQGHGMRESAIQMPSGTSLRGEDER